VSVNHNNSFLIALVLLACSSDGAPSDRADGAMHDASDDAGACEMPRTFYVDDDRDGFGRSGDGAIHGCDSNAPAGFSINARDCDDDDASKQGERYVDSDGDDYGVTDSVTCVGSEERGYADRPGDCDDDDADRSPGASEAWFDGSDSDCDGDDNPVGCIAAPGADLDAYAEPAMALPDLEAIEIDRDDSCEGPDLYLAIVGACRQCGGGTSVVVIGNRGTEPAGFTLESNADSHAPAAVLQPQTLSEPFELDLQSPSSTITVSTALDAVDCDLGNNTETVEIGFTDCE